MSRWTQLSFAVAVTVVVAFACLPNKVVVSMPDGGVGTLKLTRVEPAAAPQDGGYFINVYGANFVAPVSVTLGSAAATKVTVVSPLRIAVQTGAGSPGAVDIQVTNGDGQKGALKQAFTYLRPDQVNKKIDDCIIKWPLSFYATYGSSKTVYGRVEGQNLTNNPGQTGDTGIIAQAGFGAAMAPWERWTWSDATFNPTCTDCGSVWNEYSASLTAPTTDGGYDYTFRFQYQDAGWRYCSTRPGDGFQWSEVGQMAVGPYVAPTVTDCRLQYPTPQSHGTAPWPVTGPQGTTSPNWYGRVVVNGETGSGKKSDLVNAQIGYGPQGSSPNTWTAWYPANWNPDCYSGFCSGTSEDEYQLGLPIPAPGDYDVTFRFSVGTGGWTYCDQSGITNGGSTQGLGLLTATHGDGGSVDAGPPPPPHTSAVTFEVDNATTVQGQSVYIVGDAPELGGWDITKAVLMAPPAYPNWTVTLNMARGEVANFKFLKIDAAKNLVWEADPNQQFTVPSADTGQFTAPWQGAQ